MTASRGTNPAPTFADESDDSIGAMIQSAVAEGFATLRKETGAGPALHASDGWRQLPRAGNRQALQAPSSILPATTPTRRAYRFGMFCLGVYGKKQGIEFCQRPGDSPH